MTSGGDPSEAEPGRGVREVPPPRFSIGRSSGWRLGPEEMDLGTPRIMGILNLTPDSFSDGGRLPELEMALERARILLEEGADILDVGGESTRPGAAPVSAEEESRRVLPFIEAASGLFPVPISVDTRKAGVAREALGLGALIVNDVSALNHDPEMAGVVARAEGSLVLSHMRGTPATMGELAEYGNVASEVTAELGRSLAVARRAGIQEERIVIDPGIGFAKTGSQNLRLLGGMRTLASLGRPILVGPSRKRFIGEVTGAPVAERVPGTVAACVFAYLQGARIFRVHDVAPVAQALKVVRAIVEASE